MKKVYLLATTLLVLVFSAQMNAQDFSGLDKSPMDAAAYPSDYKVANKMIRIIYSRPQLKGRSLGELAKAGEVWRTGANEAPEITFYQDATFGGKAIKAGTYALLTIPGPEKWTIILHDKLNQWGAYFYKEGNDVARVSGTASNGKKSLEAFSITFKEAKEGAHMVMGWGTTRVSVPIEIAM